MVAIAQSVEHLIVVQKVARSSRVSHPTRKPYSLTATGLFSYLKPRNPCGKCTPNVYLPGCRQNCVFLCLSISFGLSDGGTEFIPAGAVALSVEDGVGFVGFLRA